MSCSLKTFCAAFYIVFCVVGDAGSAVSAAPGYGPDLTSLAQLGVRVHRDNPFAGKPLKVKVLSQADNRSGIRGGRALEVDDVWRKVRHLYPFARYAVPNSTSDLSSPGAFTKLLDADAEAKDILSAGLLASLACSHHFGARRSLINTHEIEHWKELLGPQKYGQLRVIEETQLATYAYEELRSVYKYTSEHFGCVHVKVEKNMSVPAQELLQGSQVLGADPVGEAERQIAALGTHSEGHDDDLSGWFQAAHAWKGNLGNYTGVYALLESFAKSEMDSNKTSALIVSWRGNLIEKYSKESEVNASTRLHGWGMSSSLLSLIVGARHAEGQVDLDQISAAPDIPKGEKEFRWLTMRNMLNMRIGRPLDNFTSSMWALFAEQDAARAAAKGTWRGGAGEYGGRFVYSDGTVNMASRELRNTFPSGPEGQAEYAAYPWKALFHKIKANSFMCESDAAGSLLFSRSCWATARDWFRIGKLVANRGTWNGRQVIPAEWISMTTNPVEGYAEEENEFFTHMWYRMDLLHGLDTPVIAARGILGQALLIAPHLDLVVVRFGSEDSALNDEDAGRHGTYVDLLGELASELKKH